MTGMMENEEMKRMPGESPAPLRQILETNIRKMEAAYAPPPDKPPKARPLARILSDGLDSLEADQVKRQESQRGLSPEVTPVFSPGHRGAIGNMETAVAKPAPPYRADTGSGRVSKSLHTGDTWGENQTLKTLQNDPAAKAMLGRLMVDGHDPDDEQAFVADASRWPHAQVMAPLTGNVMAGAAQAATPAAELSGHAINLVWGENKVGNGLARYGGGVEKFERTLKKTTDKFPMLNENGKPTQLGSAVNQGGKFMRGLSRNTVEHVTGNSLLNKGYNAYQQGQKAYRQTLEEEEARRAMSGGGYLEESESQARYAMVRAMLEEVFASLPGDLLKKATGASDDLPLTVIMQDTVLDQGKPALKQGFGNWMDTKRETDEWHQENF